MGIFKNFFCILIFAFIFAACGAAAPGSIETAGLDSPESGEPNEPVQSPKRMSFKVVWDPSNSFVNNSQYPPNYKISYRIYFGPQSRQYTSFVSAEKTEYEFNNLPVGIYFISVTAVDEQTGLESDFSNEVSVTLPLP